MKWGREDAATRAELLDLVGQGLAAHRAELIEVMTSETGKTIAEGDPEVSEAVDFAHYYADAGPRARRARRSRSPCRRG